eukprot:gnl/TRDRNA2_/TRDRNA2_48419_c0_seq1.p1 gnl/TRDRNA2_/TRDRNA2_48419_c0~~gnl/TRDRNA2_/TRDRNA2_48419_c0_seq1.p1  ORF type:complete len:294 (-),score=-0.73 gnl/TRDRNA2_/TRDRNA2_48419_c0_seq1:40-852(-)
MLGLPLHTSLSCDSGEQQWCDASCEDSNFDSDHCTCCPPGQNLINCRCCDPSCADCQGGGSHQCSSCEPGQYLQNGLCFRCSDLSCEKCAGLGSDRCIDCKPGWYLATVSTQREGPCLECDLSCSHCVGVEPDQCTECFDGFCLETSHSGSGIGVCVPCDPGYLFCLLMCFGCGCLLVCFVRCLPVVLKGLLKRVKLWPQDLQTPLVAPLPTKTMCIVCLENEACMTFVHVPTGHTACCEICVRDDTIVGGGRCPLCRETFSSIIRSYTA